VLGLPVVAVVRSHSTISRRVDAGILHGRLPESLAVPLAELLTDDTRTPT